VAKDVTLAANRNTQATACPATEVEDLGVHARDDERRSGEPSTDAQSPRCTVHERNVAAHPKTIAEAT
jgi:hypothetical protein